MTRVASMFENIRHSLALAVVAAATIVLFFMGWVALESYLGPSLSTDGQSRLHIVRGISTSILTALFLVYWAERRVRQGQATIEHRERHLASILKETLDAVVGVDKNGQVVYWNRGAEQLYGYKPEEILGQDFKRLVPEAVQSEETASPGTLEPGRHIKEFLAERLTKNGEPVSVYVTQSALGREVRECAGCEALEQNLTDVRNLEHQVVQSEKLATVGQMAAGLAHEIKNPLAGIAGAIQVLGDTLPAEDERRPVVRQVLDQVNRIEGTLRDLLTYARPKTAKLEPADLHEIIDRALGVVSLFPRKRIEVVRDFQHGLPLAMVDGELFGQVLTNLFINAVQAIAKEGVLTVRTSTSAGTIRVTVHDTGVGISPTRLNQVFDPFFTTKTRGTGLGLPICRRVVEAHNGTIDVESRSGEGAEFAITLPCRPGSQQTAPAPELPAHQSISKGRRQ